jgi:GAF domain-containing protein
MDAPSRVEASTSDRLERLVLTATSLITDVSLEAVLTHAVQAAAELIDAHYAAVGVLAPDGRLLESFTTYGISDELRSQIGPPPTGHGILGLVIREARPIRLPDLTRHADS